MSAPEAMLLGFRTATEPAKGAVAAPPAPVTLDSGDLTTHAVCLGATGSGKTGLCIDLIEEASLQGIPVLAVDLKGDLTNLALVFPELRPNDFAPWIEAEAARRAGVTIDAMAQKVADQWKAGLEADDIGPDRRRRLSAGREIRLYTPGSDAGRPVDVVHSLDLPEPHILASAEALGEAVSGAAGALLGLLGVDVEPLRSREHVLMASVIQNAWRSGRGLNLELLIAELVTPPFARVGVFEVDRFMPRREREELALKLNALVAAPGFALWTRGTPLSVPALLGPTMGDGEGRVPLALIYLAHLGERERMFALASVLGAVVRWMRGQSGTGDLRLLLYIDEVFGCLPPHPYDPPSKGPLLTLLKQARAFGVGVVLATQNPVDLDYKALSNASTWLLGRLATQPDRARVLEALSGTGGDTESLGPMLAALAPRHFLLHRAGRPPIAFRSRFAMSYLRGPLTRVELGRLVELGLVARAPEAAASAAAASAAAPKATAPQAAASKVASPQATAQAPTASPVASSIDPESASGSPVRPSLPPEISEHFLAPGSAGLSQMAAALPAVVPAAPGDPPLLAPLLLARVALRFDDARLKLDHRVSFATVGLPNPQGDVAWPESAVDIELLGAGGSPPASARYLPLPSSLASAAGWRRLTSALTSKLLAARTIEVFRNADLALVSMPGETRQAFATRAAAAAEARAADELAQLRERYAARLARLEDQLARATDRHTGETTELAGRKREEVLSAGESVLGFLFGRRSVSALSTASRRRRMTETAAHNVERAATEVDRLKQELAELNDELEDQAAELETRWREAAGRFETIVVGLERDDVHVEEMGVLWCSVKTPPVL